VGWAIPAWAPQALELYVLKKTKEDSSTNFPKNPSNLLVKGPDGYWSGFVPGVKDGDLYRFYVVGTGSEGFKRDPYARELEMDGYPNCDCIVRDPTTYQWHDAGFHSPAFNDLIVYQFHIGVFYAKDNTGIRAVYPL